MTKKPILFLITAKYPFGLGELFIDSELDIISHFFHKIVIFPTDNISDEKIIRKHPQNSNVSTVLENTNKSIFNLFSFRFFKNIISEKKYLIKSINIKFSFQHFKIASKSYLNALKLEDRLKKELKTISNSDIYIYSYWFTEGLMAGIFAKNSYKKNNNSIRVFSRAHGWDLYFERNLGNYLPWKKLMLEQCDSVFCISEDGKNYLKNKFSNIDKSKIRLSYLGVTEPNVNNEKPNLNSNNTLKIVSCSNLIALKRVELLLDAVANINTEVEWTHIGDGPLYEYLLKKSNAIMEQKPNIKINFIGFLSPKERNELLGSCNYDVFVNVSETEGLPVSIMEAMSFAIPVLATSVGGTPEIVKNNFNGFLLSANPSISDISEKLITFSNLKEDEKLILSRNAKETWATKFNAQINYENFIHSVFQL